MKAIIVDTGILYALADVDDAWHEPSKNFVQNILDILIVPITVIPEICYLLNSNLGQEAEKKFLTSIIQEELKIENMKIEDFRRVWQLLDTYANINIGFVDASLIAIAERLKINRLLTADRKHFSIIRPRHCSAFDLLP